MGSLQRWKKTFAQGRGTSIQIMWDRCAILWIFYLNATEYLLEVFYLVGGCALSKHKVNLNKRSVITNLILFQLFFWRPCSCMCYNMTQSMWLKSKINQLCPLPPRKCPKFEDMWKWVCLIWHVTCAIIIGMFNLGARTVRKLIWKSKDDSTKINWEICHPHNKSISTFHWTLQNVVNLNCIDL